MNEQHILNKFSECKNSPNCFVNGENEESKLFYMSPITKTSNNESIYDNNIIIVEKTIQNNEIVLDDDGNEIPRFENIDD